MARTAMCLLLLAMLPGLLMGSTEHLARSTEHLVGSTSTEDVLPEGSDSEVQPPWRLQDMVPVSQMRHCQRGMLRIISQQKQKQSEAQGGATQKPQLGAFHDRILEGGRYGEGSGPINASATTAVDASVTPAVGESTATADASMTTALETSTLNPMDNSSAAAATTVPAAAVPAAARDALTLLRVKAAWGRSFKQAASWNLRNPCWKWYGVTCLAPTVFSVIELHLPDQRLRGTLSPFIGNLPSLTLLDLSTSSRSKGNAFSGGIPATIGQLANLKILLLFNCRLAGPLPPTFVRLRKLTIAGLGGNRFSGGIPPAVGLMSSLQGLDLSQNALSGVLPASLGGLRSLQFLILNSNRLSGPIPPQIRFLLSLTYLQLGSNRLSGPIPPGVATLSRLKTLSLGANLLTGGVPAGLGWTTSLVRLAMGKNRLSGAIPPSLGYLTRLQLLDLGRNALGGGIPRSLGLMKTLTTLSLASNRLAGPIPSLSEAEEAAASEEWAERGDSGLALGAESAAAAGFAQEQAVWEDPEHLEGTEGVEEGRLELELAHGGASVAASKSATQILRELPDGRGMHESEEQEQLFYQVSEAEDGCCLFEVLRDNDQGWGVRWAWVLPACDKKEDPRLRVLCWVQGPSEKPGNLRPAVTNFQRSSPIQPSHIVL